MNELRVGDRVRLLTCSDNLPGTVLEVNERRGRCQVRFEDLDAIWVLRIVSLERVTVTNPGYVTT